MPYPRSKIVNASCTPYYHLISRCVRRTYLCGFDRETGESFEHRKSWVEKRILYLANTFSIGVCAYAVMSNHVHLVIHLNKQESSKMSDYNVVARWHRISVGTQETAMFLESKSYPEDPIVKRTLKQKIQEYRARLSDISWFMKYLNEYIARRANKEDDCTGHFWEGRFKSYAILDEKALITCMAYVDLNPIRAKSAKSIDQSLHTSVYKRINAARKGWCLNSLVPFKNDKINNSSLPAIDMTLLDYLSLLKSTKDCLFEKKIVKPLIPELAKMSFNPEYWLHSINEMETMFPIALGNVVSLENYKKNTGRKRIKGATNMLRLYCDSEKPPIY